MKTKKIALTKLNADPKNANLHNEKNLETIRKNIEEFGVYAPLVVQASTMNVVIGNGRLEVLIAMGRKDADCIVMDLTDAKAKKLAIADNRSSDLSEWDDTILAEILIEMGEEDAQDVGFSADDLADLLPDEPAPPEPDAVPTPPKKAITKTGMVYRLGKHRLMCGDSSTAKDVLLLMDGEKADMVFTDPPYGVSYVGKTKDALTIKSDDLSPEELKVKVKEWFDNVDLAIREGAYLLATVAQGPLQVIFANDWIERGWLRQIMVWNKDSMVLGHSEYHYKHEPILFGWKPGNRLKNTDRKKTTVWDFDRPKSSKEHPTMKPLEMWNYGIEQHSKKNWLVYEPFGGSGTSLIACEQTGRRCRMMELDPIYCDVIVQRYCNLKGIDSANVFKTAVAE